MEDISYESWAKYLCLFFNRADKPNVIEVGCGTGSLTIELKKMGFDITGIDISYDMLEIAQEKSRKSGLKIPFICQDALDIEVHRKADVLIAACDVVNYINKSNIDEFLLNINSIMNDDGVFLFDISSEYKISKIIGNNTFFEDDDDCTYIWSNELANDHVKMDITMFFRDGKVFRKANEAHEQYIYKASDLKNLLIKYGFSVEVYDFLSLNEVQDESNRIQFVCKKQKDVY